ncbi:MAG: hypothetical protein IT430_10955 [Phycisphaerales bacterium]|nr:hypothetical protein [Phycisphaerales bacterium]
MRISQQTDASVTHRPVLHRTGRVRKRYVILIVALLLCGWVVWIIIGAVTARPGPLVDYPQKLAELSASLQPEGENGWAAFVDATERFRGMGHPDRPDWPTDKNVQYDIEGYTRILQGEFDPHRVRFELALIEHAEQAGVLDALDAAARAPRAVRESFEGTGSGMLFVLLPELGQARGLAKMSTSRMRASLEAGDTEQFLRSTEHSLAIARITSHDPFLISHLVGIAVSSLVNAEIACAVVDKQLDEATCRRLLEMLERHRVAPQLLALEAERLSQLDTIQRVFSDDGRGDGILLRSELARISDGMSGAPPTLESHPIFNVTGLLEPGRAETTRLVNDYFDAAIAQCTMTAAEQAAAPVDLDVFAEEVADRNELLGLLLPAISRAMHAARGGRALHEATRVLVAIEGFEAKYGRIPDGLDALAPEFLSEVPGDPISGQRFVFTARQPTADDPRSWWLYSVGLDGTDNGGKQVPGGREWMAMSDATEGHGYDYIFNTFRDPWSDLEEAGQSEDLPADDNQAAEEAGN